MGAQSFHADTHLIRDKQALNEISCVMDILITMRKLLLRATRADAELCKPLEKSLEETGLT